MKHATSGFPHFSKGAVPWKSLSWEKYTIKMGKQSNVSSLLSKGTVTLESVYKHVPGRAAYCTLPVAFNLHQDNFLALKTKAMVTVMLRCRSSVDMTLEMLPQYTARSTTFRYLKTG